MKTEDGVTRRKLLVTLCNRILENLPKDDDRRERLVALCRDYMKQRHLPKDDD